MIKELELSHGEIQVEITIGGRSINWPRGGNHSLFKLEMFVKVVDAFEDITVTVVAQKDGLEPWVVDQKHKVKAKGECGNWKDAKEVADELIHHGFILAFEEAINS